VLVLSNKNCEDYSLINCFEYYAIYVKSNTQRFCEEQFLDITALQSCGTFSSFWLHPSHNDVVETPTIAMQRVIVARQQRLRL